MSHARAACIVSYLVSSAVLTLVASPAVHAAELLVEQGFGHIISIAGQPGEPLSAVMPLDDRLHVDVFHYQVSETIPFPYPPPDALLFGSLEVNTSSPGDVYTLDLNDPEFAQFASLVTNGLPGHIGSEMWGFLEDGSMYGWTASHIGECAYLYKGSIPCQGSTGHSPDFAGEYAVESLELTIDDVTIESFEEYVEVNCDQWGNCDYLPQRGYRAHVQASVRIYGSAAPVNALGLVSRWALAVGILSMGMWVAARLDLPRRTA